MKMTVIFGSARSDGNTRKAIELSLDGLDYELIDLLSFNVERYSYNANYRNKDFDKILELMLSSEIIIFATPVYWYSMSGIMKDFFDRLTDIVTISKPIGRQMKGKSVYLISSGGHSSLPLGLESTIAKTANYLDMIYRGHFYYDSNVESDNQELHKQAIKFKNQVQQNTDPCLDSFVHPNYNIFQAALIINNKKLLLVNRGGGLSFPGTLLSADSDYEASLVEYIKEEYGLHIKLSNPQFVQNYPPGQVGELPHYGVWFNATCVCDNNDVDIEHYWIGTAHVLEKHKLFHPLIKDIFASLISSK